MNCLLLKKKFNIDKLKEIKNENLRAELFCFVKASNSMNVKNEKSLLAKELLNLTKSKNENDLNEKCKKIINPASRVILFYYANNSREFINNDSKKLDITCQLISAKDFYSIEFIKILFNNENEFIKRDLKEKLLGEMSPNYNIVYENLNKPTVNIFENIRQCHSNENDLFTWFV